MTASQRVSRGSAGGGEGLDNAGDEAGAFGHRGDDDVFGVSVGSTADSAEAVELAEAVGARWTTVDGPSSIVAAIARVLER